MGWLNYGKSATNSDLLHYRIIDGRPSKNIERDVKAGSASWCITINNMKQLPAISRDSTEFVLAITMSNHSRGIAQRPSEPRIHLIDDHGRIWSPASSAAARRS